MLALLLLTLGSQTAFADKIWMEANNGNILTREGEIVDIVGSQLRFQSSTGKLETIPLLRVKKMEPTGDTPNAEALKLVAQGEFRNAIVPLKRAVANEKRAWRQRQLQAELVTCHRELGDIASAGETFLAIVASDPETLAWEIAPLSWRSATITPQLELQAERWLSKKGAPASQLLGASWLLPTAKRGLAMNALEMLASESTPADPRISALAEMQLWRTRIVTARPVDLGNWQRAIEQIPSEIKAGPLLVLGDALAYAKRPDEAALTYLKVPLLYNQSRAFCAEGLLAAAKQQVERGEMVAAKRLLDELRQKYPLSPASEEAATLLEKGLGTKR